MLCDDGVGVKLSEEIADVVRYPVFTGEIFADDCLEQIREEDFIVIIDAVSFGKQVGEISVLSFEQCRSYYHAQPFCHDASLLYLLLYSHIKYRGCLLGVEVSELSYKDCLSDALTCQYGHCKEEILRIISGLKEDDDA